MTAEPCKVTGRFKGTADGCKMPGFNLALATEDWRKATLRIETLKRLGAIQCSVER